MKHIEKDKPQSVHMQNPYRGKTARTRTKILGFKQNSQCKRIKEAFFMNQLSCVVNLRLKMNCILESLNSQWARCTAFSYHHPIHIVIIFTFLHRTISFHIAEYLNLSGSKIPYSPVQECLIEALALVHYFCSFSKACYGWWPRAETSRWILIC